MDILKLLSTRVFSNLILLPTFFAFTLKLHSALPVEEPDSKTIVSFQKDIHPVLKNNCLPCHNKTRSKADINLETPADILKGNDDGPLVVPGKPDESLLFLVSAHIEEDSIMPPAKNKVSATNLTARELGLMSLWIKQGAKADKKEELKLEWQTVQTAVHDPIFAVALSPDGQFAASGRSNRVDIYHIPTGTHVGELSDEKLGDSELYTRKPAHLDYVTSAVFTPDSKMIATGSFREVKTWKLKEPQSRKTGAITGFTGQSALSADGRWIASFNSQDLLIFEVSTGKQKQKFTLAGEVSAAGFSKDGSVVIAGTKSGDLQAWSVEKGESLATAKLVDQPITAVSVFIEPLRMLSAHNDNIIRVWEKPDAEGAKEWGTARELKLHSKVVTQIVPDPVSNNQVFSASEDGQVALWDISNGKNLNKASHAAAVIDLAISPDGKQFVSVGGNAAKLWGSDWKLIAELKGDILKQNEYKQSERVFAFTTSEVKYRDAELKKSEDANNKAKDRLKKAQEAKEKAEKEPVEEKKAALEKQEADRNAVEKELKDLEEIIAKLKASVDSSEEERKKAEDSYKSLQNDLKAPTDAESQTKKAADTAKADFDQKAKASKSVEDTKLNPLKGKLKEIEQKLVEAKSKIEAAQKALNEAGDDQGKKDAAQKMFEQSKEEVANLEKEKQEQSKQIASAEVELKKAKDEENASKKNYDVALKKANDAKSVADTARQKNEAAKKKLDELTASKNKFSAELSQIQKDKEAPLKKKLDDLQKKIDADRKEFDKINGPLQTAIREFANAEQDLKRTEEELAEDQKLKEEEDARLKEVTASRDKAKEAASASELPILTATFSKDGAFLYTSGEDQQIHTWSAGNGEACFVHKPISTKFELQGNDSFGSIIAIAENGELHSIALKPEFVLDHKFGSALGSSPLISRVTSLDVSPDGSLLVIGGGDPSRSGEVITFDLKNNKQVNKFEDIHSDTVLDLDFSPDGKHVASASSDKFVKVFEVATGKVARSFEGHTHHVLGVSWLITGREIVSSGADNDIKYWNFENGDRLGKGGGFTKEVTSVHTYGIGNDAIVTSAEGKVSQIQLTSNIRKAADFGGAVKYTHVSDVTPDGSLVAAGSQDGVLRIWTIQDRKLIHEFKPRVETKDSLAENK